jgi:hypothetical protein
VENCLLSDALAQDEMALSPKDWIDLDKKFTKVSEDILREVGALIKDAVHPPSGLRRWIKEWGTAGAAITGAVALVALAITGVIFAVTESSKNSEFRGSTKEHLATIDTAIIEIRTRRTADNPADPGNQQAAKEVLSEGRGTARIPEAAIREAGKGFIEAAARAPTAWPVALDFLDYRSFLNASLRSPIANIKPTESAKEIDPAWGIKMPIDEASLKPSKTDFHLYFYPPAAPIKEAAALEALDQPAGGSFGPSFISFTATPPIAITLDGFHMRNVVFKNVIVVYRGGPTRLEHVLFVDCAFRIMIGNSGSQLANAVLTSQFTSFRTPGT